MQAWAQNKAGKYQLPAETHHFAKLALAISLHELDEAVLDRQRAEWLDDLALMLAAQNPPTSRVDAAIALPEGVRLAAKE